MTNPALLWFLVGLALVLAEFAVPGVVLVFFGIGAWLVAALTASGVTPGAESQLLVFAGGSLLFLFALRRLFKGWFVGGSSTNGVTGPENLDEFLGKTARVTAAITGPDDPGTVEFKGAQWAAACESPVAVGALVRIVALDGLTFHVEPLSS